MFPVSGTTLAPVHLPGNLRHSGQGPDSMDRHAGRRVARPESDGDAFAPPRKRPGRREPEIHREIGDKLRALYAEAEQEPLPKDLISLLEMLDKAEGAAAEGAGDGGKDA